ncbi:MAG: hypothetical protein KKA65_03465 [Nanoarchaeota archaeon]|nr:hypothetical protein [Nanoarchaeota archaeon]MBU4242398.1 hypothetical protein [Nanoarchaeota archaeon]MBU4352748.1 hypothetical protein [Nanoarchaeota archaeon]MBU4456536.1 hypothetical protein [Nanoarchaeota archaeon]MCG2719269.1 hypothetical protein [Nanoarchaeota archaeon]
MKLNKKIAKVLTGLALTGTLLSLGGLAYNKSKLDVLNDNYLIKLEERVNFLKNSPLEKSINEDYQKSMQREYEILNKVLKENKEELSELKKEAKKYINYLLGLGILGLLSSGSLALSATYKRKEDSEK